MMTLPFTPAEFFQLFVAFNHATWPVLLGLWGLSLLATIDLARASVNPRAVTALLSIHWLWSGLAYHAWFFTRINPAASMFAAVFVVEGLLFAWFAVRSRLGFAWSASLRQVTGLALLVLALVYPALTYAAGHHWPAAPAFGVPCPTTLFTVGVLLCVTDGVPRVLLVIPLLWTVIGGSAAILFGVTPDLLLFVAGASLLPLLLPDAVQRRINHWWTSDAEAERPMRGDRFPQDAAYDMTLTRVAEARPEHLWPWLLQLGYRRGGLYSYDWLDRVFGVLDAPSADRLLPDYQQLRPGDVIPIGHSQGFPVDSVVPGRSLVLAGDEKDTHWCWEIALDPIDATHTRITSRSRGDVPHTFGSRIFIALLGLAAFVMTRRMLSGLATRAEALAHSA